MSITFQQRWLIVTICILATACTTEKTIIREVPAPTDATALADTDTNADADAGVDSDVALDTDADSGADTDIDADLGADTDSDVLLPDAVTASNALITQPDTQPNTQVDSILPIQAVDSTVTPNMVDGIQGTDEQAITTETLSSNEILTPTNQDNSLLFDPINSDTDDGDGTETETETGNSTSTTTGTGTGTTIDTATGTAAGATIGTPGERVNCELTLPCRWISDDAQFSVTISNADNIGEQGRLGIEYSVLTLHDTDVLIASTEPAVDDIGLSYEPSALQLGEGIGGRAQGVIAGEEITARIEFDRSSTASSLSLWTIGLSDAGLIRQPSFSNIPVGSATTQFADCANTLPCAWISPDSSATITLLGVTGSGSTNRLSANFKVETTKNTVVAIDNGAIAVGTDGMQYRGRTHAINLETGAGKLTSSAIAGAHVAGTVFFFTTQTMSTALDILSLIVYEDSPVPRWNPSFLSVPIQ